MFENVDEGRFRFKSTVGGDICVASRTFHQMFHHLLLIKMEGHKTRTEQLPMLKFIFE